MDPVTLALATRQINAVTGTGIVSGLRVVPQDPPDMSVAVLAGKSEVQSTTPVFVPGIAGVLYTPTGRRIEVQAVERIPLPDADPETPNVALVYVTAEGEIDVAVGTNLDYTYAQPDDDPIVPDGGTPLAYVDIPAGATEITEEQIRDVRPFSRLTRALSPKHVLYYDEGVEFVDWVPGFCTTGAFQTNALWEVSKQSDHFRLYVRRPSEIGQVAIVTREPVDLDGISRLYMEFGLAGFSKGTEHGSGMYFAVGTRDENFNTGYQARLRFGPSGIYQGPFRRGGVVSLDVSGVQGKHHIRIHALDASSSSVSRWTDMRVFRVWGEKE